MASIFSLFGEVLIDNTNANKSIDQTTEKAEKSSTKIGSAFSSIAKGAVAVGTTVVAGAATIGGAAYKMASQTSSAADEVDKVSQKLGLSRTAYQEWDYVLSQSGVEITSMATGLKTLTNKMDDAKNGSKSATAMFEKLGISVSDLQNMSREDAFNAVITAMQGMEDSTERAALANDLFGKSGQELTALFNQTAESTENLKNKAHELGMVMSDETIDAGVKFTDTIDTAKRSLGGIMNSLGGTVLPIVQKVLDLVLQKMPDIQALFSKLTPIVTKAFDSILPPLFSLIETLFPVLLDLITSLLPPIESLITAILPVIVSLIQQLMPFFIQIIEQVLPIIVSLIEDLMPLITQILDTILPIIIQLLQTLLPPLIQIVEAILPVIIQLLQTILPPILQIVDTVLPIIIQCINAIMPLLIQIIEAILPVIIQLIDLLLPPIMQIIDTILPVVLQLLETIMPIITSIIEAILPVLISLLDAIMPVIQPILDILFTLLQPLMDLLNLILPPICDFIKMLFDTLLPPLQAAFEAVAGVVSGVFSAAFEAIGGVFDSVKQVFGGVIDFVTGVFSGNWDKAWNGIVNIFKGIINIIPSVVEGVINGAIGIINGIIWGVNAVTGLIGIPEIPSIPNVELPRLRIGMEYVPYDDMPALLHKGERVLTESEAKEYSEQKKLRDDAVKDEKTTVKIVFGEKAIYIENLKTDSEDDIDSLTDRILELLAEKIKRKEVVFG